MQKLYYDLIDALIPLQAWAVVKVFFFFSDFFIMGNKMARNRLKAQDFHYIAKNTAFLTNDVSFKSM